ncbi:hypothetical protein KM803_13890 [Clostridium tyrobutyricum]|uniref:hypothetical protein n=1 Tax=Clostridium tyrobutyricum TaxID=1519 RepID=UPI001C3908ED|nr:hypothetical protein [Clostridium tyrobutyricum]MBV4432402.1 hypothetical protein [Clostridium tyrobutyricum]
MNKDILVKRLKTEVRTFRDDNLNYFDDMYSKHVEGKNIKANRKKSIDSRNYIRECLEKYEQAKDLLNKLNYIYMNYYKYCEPNKWNRDGLKAQLDELECKLNEFIDRLNSEDK